MGVVNVSLDQFPGKSLQLRRPTNRSAPRAVEGFTIIEVIVVMAILAASMIMFSSTATSSVQQRGVNRENLLAADAASTMVERLRGRRQSEVYSLFNRDPGDDPGGPGTAPGNLFMVAGLTQEGAPDGMAGEILFPDIDVAAGGGPLQLELREDQPDARFGTPRDLNGDSIIDGRDHSGDYFLLPVLIRIRWNEGNGDREFRLTTLLCEFNWI